MKLLKTILWLFISAVPTSLSAQTDTERKFQTTADSLRVLMRTEYEAANYPGAESLCRAIMALYDRDAPQCSDEHAYAKYSNYYNLACILAKQDKKKEAAANLVKVLDSGLTISYKQIVNDADLKGILDEEILQPSLARLKAETDYLRILQEAPEYTPAQPSAPDLGITYAPADDPDLRRVREYFHLDSVAVAGDEIATIKRLLTYIHDKIRHDGQNENPAGNAHAIAYAEACKDGSRGLNCRGLATVLNECYLSVGIPSRVITCLPKTYINDCHVINAVYSSSLGKWLWIDPTNNAWVTDDRGNMLSVREVRERLRKGQPVHVNEQANWNNEDSVSTEDYLYDYMAKNLYYIECWSRYGFNTESDREHPLSYITLAPTGTPGSEPDPKNTTINDDRLFWQAPR